MSILTKRSHILRINSIHKQILTVILSVVAILLISGCNRQAAHTEEISEANQLQSSGSLETVLDAQHLVAVAQQNTIILVDPSFPQPVEVYSFTEGEKPLVYDIDNIKMSPSRLYIVWYAPQKGFLRLDIESRQVTELYPANTWLNRYPYFVFHQGSDVMHFVDSDGTILVNLNIADGTQQTTQIPYPFGNFFRISPNGEFIAFVSGFGQTEEFPEYLITTIDGNNPVRFSTKTPLNKREQIAWTADSAGIIVIEADSQLMFFPKTNPENKELYHASENEVRIEQIRRLDNLLYYFTADNKWHVIDMDTKKKIARIPLEIAEEIHRPNFIPWYDNTFLIEETLRLNPEQFSRLWLSNYMGVKKLVLDRYHEIEIRDETPEI